MKTYPGTDLLIRICYGCEKTIEKLSDCWVDVDDNCCICTDCRNRSRDSYDTKEQWLASIVPATPGDSEMLNTLDEG